MVMGAAMLPIGCGGSSECGGQCHAPYEMDVVFQHGVSGTAALAALRACAGPPSVIRVGDLRRQTTGQLVGRLYTTTLRGATGQRALDCLHRQRGVMSASWPN
jgi:hypothetical protein